MLRRLEADYYILQESDPNFKSIKELEQKNSHAIPYALALGLVAFIP